MTHNQLQQKCWQYLWNTYPDIRYCAWHTKNEDIPHKGETKKQYVIRRSQDKAIGLLPGVWDLSLYYKKCLYIFEFKVGNDILSATQRRFEMKILQNGGQSFVVHDFETFCKQLNYIMNENS